MWPGSCMMFAHCGRPGSNSDTSLMSVIAFYQSLLDPYSDVFFILSIYRSEGVSSFFYVTSGHLLSTLPMNCCAAFVRKDFCLFCCVYLNVFFRYPQFPHSSECNCSTRTYVYPRNCIYIFAGPRLDSAACNNSGCFLYTFFSNIRQRAWFQWHRTDALLSAVLVVSMFGVEALVILRSHLMDISVFSFRACLGCGQRPLGPLKPLRSQAFFARGSFVFVLFRCFGCRRPSKTYYHQVTYGLACKPKPDPLHPDASHVPCFSDQDF